VRMIVPSVLTRDPEDLEMKIKILDQLAEVIQIDIMDGEFVPNFSVSIEEIQRVKFQKPLEIHLMVKHPMDYIQAFASIGAFRVVFHIESDDDAARVIEEIERFEMRPGIALNPPTPVEKIQPFLDSVDIVLAMGVNPGFQGQSFIPETLDKVRAIKKLRPELVVEVDGGVNPQTGPDLVKAGVDILNVGSYLFKGESVEKNWQIMQEITREN